MKTGQTIICVLAVLLIILVLLRLYRNREYEGFADGSKSVVICKADSCGHCRRAAPEFNKLLSASPITLKDGSKATVKILDAEKDQSEISQYKIKGYPTILIVEGGQTTEYPGERTASAIIDFLNSNY